uniref:Probable glutathione reductase 2 (inferred by orthology to a C. elegans protein) n=1 Tax=Anisakis simplex TaxID=6269 RepID=A0A0M3KI17_ANISI
LLIDNLAAHGVKILRRYIPESVQKQSVNGQDRLTITYRETNGTKVKSDSYDTILWAIGREPRLASLNVEGVGIRLADSGKVIANDRDETSIKNIYAIGDIAEVPTTIFTPVEYGCVGISEENAIKRYGEENVEVSEATDV